MRSNGISENYQNGNIKIIIYFGRFLGPDTCFYGLNKKDQVLDFLNTRIKDKESDPDKRWTRTWNDYLQRIKYFIRWLYNQKEKENKGEDPLPKSEWSTPSFVKIQEKRTKRISPYLETELWERDEILSIIKYEPYKRNKAALSLMWDLNARNHEVTTLRIKHIRLRERYGEGEIPHESKTGTGPILLTFSFPYVRDWLNEHPFRNELNAMLICNLNTGAPVKPDSLCTIMKQLKLRIIRMLENCSITDKVEIEKLEFLLRTKKWNPYCIRHSAITSDSDFLPEYALKKKVRWSMNSKQAARYIKRRMGDDLKQKILVQNGIITEQQIEKSRSVLNCPRCSLVNAVDNKYCSKCSYPLVPSAFDEIKEAENMKFRVMEERFNAMNSQLQSLISAFSNMREQPLVDNMAKTLFSSGLIKESNITAGAEVPTNSKVLIKQRRNIK